MKTGKKGKANIPTSLRSEINIRLTAAQPSFAASKERALFIECGKKRVEQASKHLSKQIRSVVFIKRAFGIEAC